MGFWKESVKSGIFIYGKTLCYDKQKMETEKISKEPEFITHEENGEFFLEVRIPKELRKEIQEEVARVSGAIPSI